MTTMTRSSSPAPTTPTTTGTGATASPTATATTTADLVVATAAMTTEPSRRPSFSVRSRITAAVALLTALALAGAGLLVYALGRADIDERVPDQIEQEMTEFASYQQTAGATTVPDLVRGFLGRNVPSSSELMVGFWGGESQIRSASPRGGLAGDPAFTEAVADRLTRGGVARVDTDWGPVHLDVQPLSDGTTDGAFVVAHFLDDERDALNRTMRTYAVAALLALAMVTAVAAWQAGRLLRPVRTLRETAEEIEGGDLSRRIPETGNDDITDLTRTVNAMLARLEQAFDSQRAFLDDAGHELRTPLTIVRGHLELLSSGDADEVARTRDLVLDEVDRMSRLVDDLIMLAKAERPDFFEFRNVEVAPLVDAVAEKCRALGDRSWVVDERPDLAVLLDEQRITQALVQLAHNAVKHTVPGDTIGLGAADSGGTVTFWVRDTGPGVADEHKGQIFDRFGRGTVSPDDEGFGLGLSIVAAIAAGHGGTVDVRDEVPSGARFVIEIPTRRSVVWPAS